MPEALLALFETPGLTFVALTSLIAGVVYGFAGFGSALIFMPLATIFWSPPLAIAAFSISSLASLVTVVPGAWPVADKRQTLLMLAASLVTIPIGVALLIFAPETAIRTSVCVLTLVTLAALVSGWKLPVTLGTRWRVGVGALSGLTGGSTGLNGPPVILFNLGSQQTVEVTRANLTCFLTLNSVCLSPVLFIQGLVGTHELLLGALLVVPYAVGTRIGAFLFNPNRADLYRIIAYTLIGTAGIMGLPIWD